MNKPPATPFARPLYVMLKPVGATCNLRCKYCYYLEKRALYREADRFVMSDELLERFIVEYLGAQTALEVLFTWHGGEPLMRPIEFYRKALQWQKKYGRGSKIDNSIQTNGTLLNPEWCRFLAENHFLVGISIDGNERLHNRYRRMQDGRPTFHRVMHGVELLKKHGVEFNVMGVVNDYNVDYPLEFYHFFKRLGAHFIQFSPIVETFRGLPAPWNVPPAKWGDFLITLFDEWVRSDVGTYFVQYFDATLANWMHLPPGVCSLARTCGHAGVMEFNGDVYSCDHYVFPSHKLGNLSTHTLTEMMYSERQLRFGADKYEALPRQCLECTYLFACHGECPKNRIIRTSTGEEGLNYLCPGYYKFLHHVSPYMDFMKRELLAERSPANIMYYLQRHTL
ncbi:MAG: anaerobic sulfatase-maturation protein [Tannerellaceae bacterium]|jgi:uncharacterized protein|nr:anaerobic sulfatase-maturation protein [Tannerellaceae bacterium]